MCDLYAKDSNGKSSVVWLECTYKLNDNVESEKFIIDTKNQTVENPTNGVLYNITGFSDDRLMFDFNYEGKEMSVQYNISRKTGVSFYTLNSGDQSWSFKGSCKKISSPKPIF